MACTSAGRCRTAGRRVRAGAPAGRADESREDLQLRGEILRPRGPTQHDAVVPQRLLVAQQAAWQRPPDVLVRDSLRAAEKQCVVVDLPGRARTVGRQIEAAVADA